MAELPSLGKRGEGWVGLQFVLMASTLVLGVVGPAWPDSARWWLKGAGVALAILGAVVVANAGRALGSGLTPFPRPSEGAQLVVTGPYAFVRHPVYSGGILVFSGISLALSPWALIGTAALALLWALKSRVEERFLRARFDGYEEYATRTRYRLVPYVY